MSWHRQYRGKGIGRILHFVYHYCGFDVAEVATIDCDSVTYHGEVIATFKFLSDTDIPFFTFNPIVSHSGTDMKAIWDGRQRDRWQDAVAEADDTKPEPCLECRALKLELSIWKDSGKKRAG